MKSYKIARYIELTTIIIMILMLVLSMTSFYIEAVGEKGVEITRYSMIGVGALGMLIAWKWAVCPHCRRHVNVLSKNCPQCGEPFEEKTDGNK